MGIISLIAKGLLQPRARLRLEAIERETAELQRDAAALNETVRALYDANGARRRRR